jgi:hypothetical protein
MAAKQVSNRGSQMSEPFLSLISYRADVKWSNSLIFVCLGPAKMAYFIHRRTWWIVLLVGKLEILKFEKELKSTGRIVFLNLINENSKNSIHGKERQTDHCSSQKEV